MIPVLHRIAGERLPVVVHVAARTVGTHAMSIFGDHSDVMCCRNTGLALLCSGSVQEIADLTSVAHLAALKARVPFLHFFDGFRTSHELNKVELPDQQALVDLLDQDALHAFKAEALNPEHPKLRNTVQNGDVYFQVREANNLDYAAVPEIVEDYLQKISQLTGREYHLFNYYGAEDATEVVIAMGSVAGTCREAVEYLLKTGRKVAFSRSISTARSVWSILSRLCLKRCRNSPCWTAARRWAPQASRSIRTFAPPLPTRKTFSSWADGTASAPRTRTRPRLSPVLTT